MVRLDSRRPRARALKVDGEIRRLLDCLANREVAVVG